MTRGPTIEFGFSATPPVDFETGLREALNHPVNMKRIVAEMEATLDVTDLAAVKRHLDLLAATAQLSRSRYGTDPGGTYRILNNAIHRTRARVARADEAGDLDDPEDTPIKPNTVRGWGALYGFLSEEELETVMRTHKRPLTPADLRRLRQVMVFRGTATGHPRRDRS